MHAERIIETIVGWAREQPTIQAAALVGSHARGTAREGSDIDFVLLTTNPHAFQAETAWLDTIGWDAIGARLGEWQDEHYGQLWSRRLLLEQNNGEIELGFALPSWADVDPLDPGTRAVIANGCRILHDPKNILGRLCAAVAGLGK
jgi:uncharacterized protein